MLAIVQSRMSSERLPGKAMLALGDRPVLGRVIDQLRKSRQLARIVVATSTETEDIEIVDFCNADKIECFRGDLENVALRFRDLLLTCDESAFVRISGDSPLIDYSLIDEIINMHEAKKTDISTNIFSRTFPKGQSVEVISSRSFFTAYALMKTPEHYEHVTKIFYEQPESFRIGTLESGGNYDACNLSIDTMEDYHRIRAVYAKYGNHIPSWRELIRCFDERSESHG